MPSWFNKQKLVDLENSLVWIWWGILPRQENWELEQLSQIMGKPLFFFLLDTHLPMPNSQWFISWLSAWRCTLPSEGCRVGAFQQYWKNNWRLRIFGVTNWRRVYCLYSFFINLLLFFIGLWKRLFFFSMVTQDLLDLFGGS